MFTENLKAKKDIWSERVKTFKDIFCFSALKPRIVSFSACQSISWKLSDGKAKRRKFPKRKRRGNKIGLKLQPKFCRKYEKLFTLLHKCYCFSDFPLFFFNAFPFILLLLILLVVVVAAVAWNEILTNTNTAFNWFFLNFFFCTGFCIKFIFWK